MPSVSVNGKQIQHLLLPKPSLYTLVSPSTRSIVSGATVTSPLRLATAGAPPKRLAEAEASPSPSGAENVAALERMSDVLPKICDYLAHDYRAVREHRALTEPPVVDGRPFESHPRADERLRA